MYKKFLTFLFLLTFLILNNNLALAEEVETPPAETPPVEEVIIPQENLTIRNGSTIIWQGTVDLPEEGVVSINGHDVNSRSILALIHNIDQGSEDFEISDLSYNESFGAFILNCITPSGQEPICYKWQYVVDGDYPYVSLDQNILDGEEIIYLFFGEPNRLTLNNSSISNLDELIVNTEKYDYENDGWLVRTGVTVGITKTNPDDLWSPLEIGTQMVDEDGQAKFSNILVGSYGVGIKEDYYWPLLNLEVIEVKEEAPQEEQSTENTGGGGGGSQTSTSTKTFSIPKAISFLENVQNSDGSFTNDMYTDWVAVGLAGTSESTSLKNKLKDFLKSDNLDSEILTDYERRAMALMAFNINPYNETNTNYIKKITDSFDGEQLGDSSIYNDDIFGLLVLSHVGYDKNDEIIKKVVAHVLSKQKSSGSWEGVDLTSATIEALSNFKNIDGVSQAIKMGVDYLIASQKQDGGFGNSFATSWAIQALLDQGVENKIDQAVQFLGDQQEDDGGVGDISEVVTNRVWATSYALPAVLGLSWNDILNDFEKVVDVVDESETSSLSEDKNFSTENIKEILPIPRSDLGEGGRGKIVKKEIKPVFSEVVKEEPILNNSLQASVGLTSQNNSFFKSKFAVILVVVLGVILGFVIKFKV